MLRWWNLWTRCGAGGWFEPLRAAKEQMLKNGNRSVTRLEKAER